MQVKWLVGIAVVAAAYLWFKRPSLETVIARTSIDEGAGTIDYDGVRYASEWGEPVSIEGDLRLKSRASFRFHVITHDALVTTGDLSDPDKVEVTSISNGTVGLKWKTQPRGEYRMLHLIPRDRNVLRQLEDLQQGDHVRIKGREEQDGSVKGSDGNVFAVSGSSMHFIVLVDDAQRY